MADSEYSSIIWLNKDKYIIVDNDDFPYLNQFKWYFIGTSTSQYARRRVGDKVETVHRIITSAKKGEVVDHKNGNGLDNRRGNLRLGTAKENTSSRRVSKNNKTGYKGVQKSGKRWRAMIKVNYKAMCLGHYRTPEEAALAYDRAAKKHFGDYAFTNRMLGLLRHIEV